MPLSTEEKERRKVEREKAKVARQDAKKIAAIENKISSLVDPVRGKDSMAFSRPKFKEDTYSVQLYWRIYSRFLKHLHSRVKYSQVNKDRVKNNGEVFTPAGLVDRMVGKKDDEYWLSRDKFVCDLCAGLGQFTLGIIRKKLLLDPHYDIVEYLNGVNHFILEFDDRNVASLFDIFGRDIFLAHGDAMKLSALMDSLNDNDKGYYKLIDGSWKKMNTPNYRILK